MDEERASVRRPGVARRPPALPARANSDAVVTGSTPAARTLHRRLGNQGTQAFAARLAAKSGVPAAASVATPPIQASLTVSQPGDPYELEADRVADSVMRMPTPSTQAPGISTVSAAGPALRRSCATCEAASEHKAEVNGQMRLDRKEASGAAFGVAPAVETNVHILQGQGSPLLPATRAFFEPSFGADFSQVRVNTGPRADETARSLGARAFTVGSSISFAAGQFAPTSREGRHLLAHELTHVVQQHPEIRRTGTAVQRQQASPGAPPQDGDTAKLDMARMVGVPQVQADHWYNISIPGTDYQFDPSIEGVKTAAGVVKDAAVESLQWVADEIMGLVNGALDWLKQQWAELKGMAHAAWDRAKAAFNDIIGFFKNPLGFLADAIMGLDTDALTRGWATFTGLVNSIANGFKAMVDNILGAASALWGVINRFATGVLNRVASLTSNFLFRKLPDVVQKGVNALINTLRSLWQDINDGWTALVKEVKQWADSAIDAVMGFVNRVMSFGINVVISGIVLFGQVVLFLKDLFTHPRKYVDLLAARTVQAFENVETRFAEVIGQYLGGTKAAPAAASFSGPAATTVMRAPAPDAGKKGSASWAEIGSGVLAMMGKKWAEFKANPMRVVVDLLIDLIYPMAGNVKDIIQLFKDIWHIVTGPLSAGSLEELWTSLLLILDIPILIYHTVVGVLMRTLTLPLIVASFIPHPVVKGLAALVGYGLLGAFVQSEQLNIGHKLLLLKTGSTTAAQKEEAYNRIADSLIAFAMALAIALFILLLHFLGNIAKGIYNFVKGKVFGIDPAPAGGKGSQPGKGKGPKGEPDEGKLGEAKGDKGTSSKDGKRRLRMNEGECEVCASPCEKLRKKYGSLVTDKIEAKIKAVEDNPKLNDAAKEEALKPIEQELADALKAKAASVKGPYSHLPDNIKVEPGRDFQPGQKPKILAENANQHGGKLFSDEPLDPWYGKELEPPLKGPQEPGKFARVPDNQAQVDHIIPKTGPNGEPLGSNSYSNAKVVSAEYNRGKSNKL
ncbi:protein of unknown function [Paraburkholderia steynii]|uniref:eCIS core domain-containing protein n=1 Tax=Paraburkholderia steynii TaxID=1245441 RepID=A0A7Z7BH84_9BURK|nr:DUF4157 domain-containing protein [Paraburkholderia steynii]SDJ22521.1 protein of unknown function [Paraburkholderia steynii]